MFVYFTNCMKHVVVLVVCVCVGGGGGGGIRRDKSADYIYLAFSGGYLNFHLF